ncbi:Sorting nexin-18 [Plecturocebus cupreus]
MVQQALGLGGCVSGDVPGHFGSHLPEKRATGCLQEDFVFTHRKRLICEMSHAVSCPVLAQCHVLQHFLTGPSSAKRRPGNKRNAFCMAPHLSRKEN